MTADLTQQLLQTADEKLTLILTIVQSLTIRVDNIDTRLLRVEQTVDETRPILQKLVIDVEDLKEGQEALRSDLLAFRKRVDYRFMTLSGDVLSRCIKIEQRVTILELNSTPPNSQT